MSEAEARELLAAGSAPPGPRRARGGGGPRQAVRGPAASPGDRRRPRRRPSRLPAGRPVRGAARRGRAPRRAGDRGPHHQRARGVLLVLPALSPPRHGCSGCSACIPARTSPPAAAASLAAVPPAPGAAGPGRAGPGAPADRARARPVRRATTCSAPTPPSWRTATRARTIRDAAVRRVLDHYLHTAHHAAMVMEPYVYPVMVGPPCSRALTIEAGHQRGCAGLVHQRTGDAAGRGPARRPCRVEQPRLAARLDPEHVPAAARVLGRPGHRMPGGAAAARCTGDLTGQAHMLHRLAAGYAQSGRVEDAPAVPGRTAAVRGDRQPRQPGGASTAFSGGWRSGSSARPPRSATPCEACELFPGGRAAGPGRRWLSRMSVSRTPCSATTTRPSAIARAPWPPCGSWESGTGRRPPGTASAYTIRARRLPAVRHVLRAGHRPVPRARRPVQRGRHARQPR